MDENTGSEPKVDENKPPAQFESYVAQGAQHIVLGIYSPAGRAINKNNKKCRWDTDIFILIRAAHYRIAIVSIPIF